MTDLSYRSQMADLPPQKKCVWECGTAAGGAALQDRPIHSQFRDIVRFGTSGRFTVQNGGRRHESVWPGARPASM